MSFGLGAVLPNIPEDVVVIYEQGEEDGQIGDQLFEEANIIHASIDEHQTFFRHPLENGRSIIDHRILQPVTIEFRLILTDSISPFRALRGGELAVRAKDVYGQIREAFIAGTLLSIQTRTNTYRNQIIQSIPHEESSNLFDGVSLQFNSSEIQFETSNTDASPADDTNTNTVDRGRQVSIPLAPILAASVLISAKSVFF